MPGGRITGTQGISNPNDLTKLHVDSRLFSHFTDGRRPHRFTVFDLAARYGPQSGIGPSPPPNQQQVTVSNYGDPDRRNRFLSAANHGGA